jgi:drug/metabolite transporter (DMT)-like permease
LLFLPLLLLKPMPTRSQTRTAHLLLLAVVLVWGTTFTLVKSALTDASPLLFNLLRMALAFAVLAPLNWRSLKQATPGDLRYAAFAGVFLGLGYQFQTAGLALTTPSKSAFITGLVVVIVPLLSTIPGVRPAAMPAPRLTGLVGALIAFSGLVLLTTPSGSARALLSGIGLGEALTLGCAVAFAAHLLTLSHAARLTSARTLGTVQIGVAALLMLITLPLGGRPYLHLSPRLFLALAITGLLATAAAFTIQSWAQQHLSPTHTALIFTLEPVFAWLTSLLFFHEHLGPRALTGAALILGGILVTELWPAPSPLSLHPRD